MYTSLHKLYTTHLHPDLTIIANTMTSSPEKKETKAFEVHKFILSALSPHFFNTLLLSNLAITEKGHVEGEGEGERVEEDGRRSSFPSKHETFTCSENAFTLQLFLVCIQYLSLSFYYLYLYFPL